MNAAKRPINGVEIQVNIEKLTMTHLCFDLKIVQSLSNLHDLTPIEPYVNFIVRLR